MHDPRPRRLLPFRDRPALLERERELAATIAAVDQEQRRLALQYLELRLALDETHRLLWPPEAGGRYRKTRRPPVPGPAAVPPPLEGARVLGGRPLRYSVLACLVRAGRPLTLTEIHRELHLSGYRLGAEHPVKQLGDALTYEARRGRVRRVARGTYSIGDLSPARRRALRC